MLCAHAVSQSVSQSGPDKTIGESTPGRLRRPLSIHPFVHPSIHPTHSFNHYRSTVVLSCLARRHHPLVCQSQGQVSPAKVASRLLVRCSGWETLVPRACVCTGYEWNEFRVCGWGCGCGCG